MATLAGGAGAGWRGPACRQHAIRRLECGSAAESRTPLSMTDGYGARAYVPLVHAPDASKSGGEILACWV
jgi:hypothetical protein